MRLSALLPAVALSAVPVSGCESAYERLSADPLPPTSFLPDHQLLVRQPASFPFGYMWYEKSLDWEQFKKIKLDRVDLSHKLADRENDPSRMISLTNFTWYGHSKEIIDGWAKAFAEMAVSDDPKKIRPKEFPISIIKL